MADLGACIRVTEETVKLLKADGYSVVEGGEYPAATIQWGESHLLLVRHFGSSFTISLPIEPSFPYRSLDELIADAPQLEKTVEEYRKKHPTVMTMADAILTLRPSLQSTDGPWVADFPGTPVPSEAWLKNDNNSIGLFQEGDSVRAVIWVGSDMRSLTIDSPEKLAHLPEWALPNLPAQARTATRMAEEDEKRAAIEPPPLSEVLAALRNGTRLQLGVGRWYCIYFMADGKLRRTVFDEGYTDEEDATEEELVDSLEGNAEQAWKQL